ncbi:MAG: hypothetical protein WCL34_14170 [Methylococcaceae bacterium]
MNAANRVLAQHDFCLIFDIIMNQDGDIDAESIAVEIETGYGIAFSIKQVQSVIDELVEDGAIEMEKDDKTIDLFNHEFTGTKKPAATGNLAKTFLKKSRLIMSRKQRAVITRFKKHCEYEQSLAASRLNSLSFLDSGFFGGRYGY